MYNLFYRKKTTPQQWQDLQNLAQQFANRLRQIGVGQLTHNNGNPMSMDQIRAILNGNPPRNIVSQQDIQQLAQGNVGDLLLLFLTKLLT